MVVDRITVLKGNRQEMTMLDKWPSPSACAVRRIDDHEVRSGTNPGKGERRFRPPRLLRSRYLPLSLYAITL